MTDQIQDTRRPFTTVDDLIITDTDLSWKAKVVYLVLAQHSNNKTFTAFPSYKRMGKLSGSSESSAKRGVKELLSKGYIKKKRRFKENGSETSSLYYLIDLHKHPKNKENKEGCSNRTGGVVYEDTGGGLTDQRTRLKELDSNNNNIYMLWDKKMKTAITAHKKETLQTYTDELPIEVIEMAMDKTLEYADKKGYYGYCKKILDEWLNEGVKTVDDVKELDEQYNQKDAITDISQMPDF